MLKVLKNALISCGIKRFQDMDIHISSYKGIRTKCYRVETKEVTLSFNTYTGLYTIKYNDRGTNTMKSHSDIQEIQNYITNIILTKGA